MVVSSFEYEGKNHRIVKLLEREDILDLFTWKNHAAFVRSNDLSSNSRSLIADYLLTPIWKSDEILEVLLDSLRVDGIIL